jgi:hypothetical protein
LSCLLLHLQLESSTAKLNTMAFPPQYREPPALPSIIVPTPGDRYRSHTSHHGIPYSGSPAMSIPGLQTREDVPPPLPPPRYPGYDQPSALAENMREKREYAQGSFASGYGSMTSSYHEDRPSYQRRSNTAIYGERDEGYASYSSTDR